MARPREFDPDIAIEQALRLFWSKGYEGTTLSDLSEAMQINRPSLYAAFGSKEGLFHLALDRYDRDQGAGMRAALEAPTARAAAHALMRAHADRAGRRRIPRGCLLVQGALACGDDNQPVRAELARRRSLLEAATRERFERARREGEVLLGKPAELARWVWTICQGLAVQAASGATREQLREVVELAMRAWPE